MKVGTIVSIKYGELTVKVTSSIRGGSVNIRGTIYYFGSIGSYLKVSNALDENIICEVISITDSDRATSKEQSFNIIGNRELIIKPIGTVKKQEKKQAFTLGISVYPSLYGDVQIVTQEDLAMIMEMVSDDGAQQSSDIESQRKGKIHEEFYLGLSKNLINYPISLNINKFFQIHTAVLGNTGSGKSNTIAHILQQIMKKDKYYGYGAKFILFDTNGEYANALKSGEEISSKMEVKHYKPKIEEKANEGAEYFTLPHYLLNIEEWCSFLMATEATQRPFWKRVLDECMRFYAIAGYEATDEEGTKYVHYFLDRICGLLYNVIGQADNDTVAMTSAKNLLGSIKKLLTSKERGRELEKIGRKKIGRKSLLQHIEALILSTELDFGQNKKPDDKKTKQPGEKDLLRKKLESVRENIEESYVSEIIEQARYQEGKYFSYKFLKIAAEICLLEDDSTGSRQLRNWTATLLTRLDVFIEGEEYKFMREERIAKGSAADNIKDYLYRTYSISEDNSNGNQIIIIDTSDLPPDALEVLTSVTARLIYDHRRNANKRQENPIHIVLDEAHRYIKKDKTYLLKENIFERIAREGRKYSCFLLLSSQRPSELSETVLSQCGNYIVHRIQNDLDIRYIQAVMPVYASEFSDKIKQAVPGEALIFGQCVPMPLHVSIHRAKPDPDSKNCDISEEWFGKAAKLKAMK